MTDCDRIGIFVDSASAWSAAFAAGIRVDYEKVYDFIDTEFGGEVVFRKFYAVIPEENQKSVQGFLHRMQHMGYDVFSKEPKRFYGEGGKVVTKHDIHVKMCADMIQQAANLDMAFVFSGKTDFADIIDNMHEQGCKVTMVSTRECEGSPIIGKDLLEATDYYYELSELVKEAGG